MNDFQRGYICAVSCIVRGHGAGTETEEALRALGLVRWDELEEYDQLVFTEAGMQKFFTVKEAPHDAAHAVGAEGGSTKGRLSA